jgi:two-component system, NarL family, nitrate/nitrite response regulator NarL
MTMARVLTADRQPLLNQALEALLTRDGRHEVVGRCSTKDEVPLAVRRYQPDLLLLDADVAMSGTPTVIEQALEERPNLKVLVLALELDLRLVVEAVGAGAVGVVLKTSGPTTVATAVESAVGNGELEPRATMPRVFRQLLDAQYWTSESPVHRLSLRERQVLALLGQGWSNEAIASVLYISPHTVRTHVQNILEKLEMHSRLEAATFAMERADELPAVP